MRKIINVLKGGPGSGNFGHAGRPGEQGGSSSGGGDVDYPDLDDIPTNEGIEAAEENWAGGLADFGDPQAAIDIQAMDGYFDYRGTLEDKLREKLGDEFNMYRSIHPDALEAWKNGEDMSPMGFTTDRKFAENWKNFAGNEGKPEGVIIRVRAKPEDVVMRGKLEENELVLDGNAISYSDIEVVKAPKGFKKVLSILKGGPGSGNFGHDGCIGVQGGSCNTSPMQGDKLQRIGNKGGSIPGGIYQDPETGKKYVVKAYKNPQQAAAEVATNMLYRAAGIPVPDSRIVHGVEVNGQKVTAVANEMIDGLKDGDKSSVTAAKGELVKGYGVDAMVANWDVVGMSHDNIGFDKDGKAIRLDNGGSLVFRAQGGAKDFPANKVDELNTLLDPSKNGNTTALFADALKDKATRLDALSRVAKITNQNIEDAIKSSGLKEAGMSQEQIDRIQLALEGRRDIITSLAANLKQKMEEQAAKGPRKAPNPKGYKFGFDFTEGQKAQMMRIHDKYNLDQLRARIDKLDTPNGVRLSNFVSGDTTDASKAQMADHPDNWEMRKTTVAYLLKAGIVKSTNEKISLVRGVGLDPKVAAKMKVGKIFDAGDVTCWTDQDKTAFSFARQNSSNYDFEKNKHNTGKIPVIIRSGIPVKKVLATYKTGAKAYQGYKHESEWTIHQARRARITSREIKTTTNKYGEVFKYIELYATYES